MNKTRIQYFEQEDVLHVVIAEEPGSSSLELSPDITVELNDKNEMIGVEILNASAFLRDAVLESLVRPHVIDKEIEAAYQRMAQDENREAEALEWIEGTLGELPDETR